MNRRQMLATLGAGALMASAAWGQTGDTAAALETLAATLEKNYVLPDVGARYAAMLRANIASYAAITDRAALGTKITADLQAINRDGHLKVREDRGGGPPRPGPGGTGNGPPPRAMGVTPPPAITETKWLAPGVAFIGFNMFPGTDESVQRVSFFMKEYTGAKALVIDARTHRGGGLAEMDVMLPFLYAQRTELVAMDLRRSVYEARGLPFESDTLIEAPSPPGMYRRVHVVTPNSDTRWRNAKVFYLTANRTASAAEHLALAFKRTKRATLIGAATAGANHFGGPEPIGAGLEVWLPVGRTSDPVTNWDWETVGVAPDVACDPAVAPEEALKRV